MDAALQRHVGTAIRVDTRSHWRTLAIGAKWKVSDLASMEDGESTVAAGGGRQVGSIGHGNVQRGEGELSFGLEQELRGLAQERASLAHECGSRLC